MHCCTHPTSAPNEALDLILNRLKSPEAMQCCLCMSTFPNRLFHPPDSLNQLSPSWFNSFTPHRHADHITVSCCFKLGMRADPFWRALNISLTVGHLLG